MLPGFSKESPPKKKKSLPPFFCGSMTISGDSGSLAVI